MPDDQIIEEVAEQDPDPLVEDKESNEDAAFASETEDDDHASDTGLEKKDKPAELESEKSETEEKPKEEGDEDKKTESGDDEQGEDDEDEDIKRGKEILAAQEKADADRKKAEEEAEQQRQQDEQSRTPKKLTEETWTDKDFKEIFAPAVPKNLFPKEPVKLEDGTELDFNHVINEFPELPHMVFMLANNMVRQMMNSGAIVGGSVYDNDKKEFASSIARQGFADTVTHPVYGVPEAKSIVTGENFQKWFENQKPEIKALRTSGSPWDYIKLIKRFQNKEIIGKAKDEVKETDEKRRKKKEIVDGIFKADKKSGAKPKKSNQATGIGSPEDELEAFESEDKDDFV